MPEEASTNDKGSSDRSEVYLFVDPEIERLLADNHTDLIALLQRQGVEVERSAAPSTPTERGHKEPATIILASAALITALTPVIRKILSNLSRKDPVIVEELVPEPVEDSRGIPVRDAAGNPTIRWVSRNRIIEPATDKEAESYSISGPLGIRISYNRS
jgi:hypothetical protein